MANSAVQRSQAIQQYESAGAGCWLPIRLQKNTRLRAFTIGEKSTCDTGDHESPKKSQTCPREVYDEVYTMYGFSVQVDMSFEQAIERITDALKTEGFGVLSDIDVQATLKSKLGFVSGSIASRFAQAPFSYRHRDIWAFRINDKCLFCW